MDAKCYRALQAKVIIVACEDYLKAVKDEKKWANKEEALRLIKTQKHKEHPEEIRMRRLNDARQRRNEVIRFFKSDWYYLWCSISPEVILKKLGELAARGITQL
jgi:hypothetical protein